MSYTFTISPDFNTKHLAGWFVFNTWLQRTLGEAVHLRLFDDFDSCRKAVLADEVDCIYANPYDAALLLRQRGFLPLVHPSEKPDEAIIAVSENSTFRAIEDLPRGIRVSSAFDPEVETICQIMLEPANLGESDYTLRRRENYLLVAKDLMGGEADVGFFLAETFNDLSQIVRGKLRVLLQSDIQVVHHMLLLGPGLAAHVERLREGLVDMGRDPKGQALLQDLGVRAWLPTDREEAEFMIDIMDTLL